MCLAFKVIIFIVVSLAKKKPTWQSSEKYSSHKAVDGNFSLVGDSCTSEASPTDVTWMVDLEDIKSIAYIWITYRTDNAPFGKIQCIF